MDIDLEEALFAKLLAMKGIVSEAESRHVIKELRASGSRRGYEGLGQFLLKKKTINALQFASLIQDFREKLFSCSKCAATFYLEPCEVERRFKCKRCGGDVVVPPRLPEEGVSSLSTGAKTSGGSEGLSGLLNPLLDKEAMQLESFGPHDILGEIARGAMGVVYRAKRRDGFGGTVALKVLKADSGASSGGFQRFRKEAQTVSRLRHPNIVSIREVGIYKGFHYFTMDLVAGKTLQEILDAKSMEARPIIEILEKVARALAYAHQQGVIHRDMKPANIVVDRDGEPKITDFGLARSEGAASTGASETGTIVGTPYYLSPEQVEGESRHIDGRADIYSLGVILYQVLTGELPFSAGDFGELCYKILKGRPRRPRSIRNDIPEPLETVCLKAMEKSPKGRYPNAGEMADDLRRYLSGRPVQARISGVTTRVWWMLEENPGTAFMVLFIVLSLLAVLLLLILGTDTG
jgi:hypothetical protein